MLLNVKQWAFNGKGSVMVILLPWSNKYCCIKADKDWEIARFGDSSRLGKVLSQHAVKRRFLVQKYFTLWSWLGKGTKAVDKVETGEDISLRQIGGIRRKTQNVQQSSVASGRECSAEQWRYSSQTKETHTHTHTERKVSF